MSALLSAIAGIANSAEPVRGWVTGGQPSTAQLTALKQAGCEVVLDNRDPMEPRPLDEPAAVRAAGMEYINLPIVHGAVTVATMARMHETLKQLAGRKALLHCSSGNRTAAGLIPYFMLDEQMEEEEATELAMGIGLRSAELMEIALAYVKTRS